MRDDNSGNRQAGGIERKLVAVDFRRVAWGVVEGGGVGRAVTYMYMMYILYIVTISSIIYMYDIYCLYVLLY